MKHASLTPWFTTCTFSTVNSRWILSNWDRILCERVCTLVTSFENICSTPQCYLSKLKLTGVLLDKNTNVIFVQIVTGTAFEISLITKTKWNSVFCHSVVTVRIYTQTTGQKWPVVSRMVRRNGKGHPFLGDLLWSVMLFFCWSKGEGQDFRNDNTTKKPQPPPPPPNKKRTFTLCKAVVAK